MTAENRTLPWRPCWCCTGWTGSGPPVAPKTWGPPSRPSEWKRTRRSPLAQSAAWEEWSRTREESQRMERRIGWWIIFTRLRQSEKEGNVILLNLNSMRAVSLLNASEMQDTKLRTKGKINKLKTRNIAHSILLLFCVNDVLTYFSVVYCIISNRLFRNISAIFGLPQINKIFTPFNILQGVKLIL